MKEALEAFAERIREWRPGERADAKTRQLYTKDRKDMRAVLSACRKNNWKKARELTMLMDTILRDEIPDKLWNLMNQDH